MTATIPRAEAVSTTIQVGADLLARQAKTNAATLHAGDTAARQSAALDAVADLHQPVHIEWANRTVCSHCYTNTPLTLGDPWSGLAGRVTYPCPTMIAVGVTS